MRFCKITEEFPCFRLCSYLKQLFVQASVSISTLYRSLWLSNNWEIESNVRIASIWCQKFRSVFRMFNVKITEHLKITLLFRFREKCWKTIFGGVNLANRLQFTQITLRTHFMRMENFCVAVKMREKLSEWEYLCLWINVCWINFNHHLGNHNAIWIDCYGLYGFALLLRCERK